MKNKAISRIMLALLLIGMLTLAFNIQQVKASGTVYIKADGTVEGTDKIQRDGDVYTFTGNINDSMRVERDNIVVDGAGYTLQGTGSQAQRDGISLYANHVTIKNMEIENFWTGIGIRLAMSHNNTISENNITANDFGIGGGGGEGAYSYNYIISRNNITNNNHGIVLYHTEYTTVWGNTIANNGERGVNLVGMGQASNNIFYHNNFINNTKHVNTYEEAIWDNGYPSGGNYWDDYTGLDANNDGIGDIPHDISTWGYSNVDRYPLMNPLTPSWVPPEHVTTTPPQVQVGVKAGDWIICTYTISGWPVGTPYPEWLKMEFLSVEGKTANIRVTMHMSDGTEPTQTMTVDVAAGSGAFQGLSGFVISANCTTGDSVYISGYGNVTIASETQRTYAGASRTVVYASFSQLGSQLTYYWDKETGVMMEASITSGSITATGKATETNMWEAVPSPFWMQWWFFAIVAVVIVALAVAVYFLKKRKPQITTPLPSEGTDTIGVTNE